MSKITTKPSTDKKTSERSDPSSKILKMRQCKRCKKFSDLSEFYKSQWRSNPSESTFRPNCRSCTEIFYSLSDHINFNLHNTSSPSSASSSSAPSFRSVSGNLNYFDFFNNYSDLIFHPSNNSPTGKFLFNGWDNDQECSEDDDDDDPPPPQTLKFDCREEIVNQIRLDYNQDEFQHQLDSNQIFSQGFSSPTHSKSSSSSSDSINFISEELQSLLSSSSPSPKILSLNPSSPNLNLTKPINENEGSMIDPAQVFGTYPNSENPKLQSSQFNFTIQVPIRPQIKDYDLNDENHQSFRGKDRQRFLGNRFVQVEDGSKDLKKTWDDDKVSGLRSVLDEDLNQRLDQYSLEG